ncbi:Phosphatidylinositol transfer protein 2 [Tritrichomonas foetus]|uniref:Phosphatidylinositol transfer protein 2 n=1 Tax=Tritrichomonas foetus TaxID=1144522 RepID=A0A1J4K0F5_9EUKA|nr:Phosphatidylinositol transfer protein 2 [Tritrichomonas foetus]|eukprot:OHT02997.1 Phosphatidylinositol transfer protein 2 [Tritrichomonas foetus]
MRIVEYRIIVPFRWNQCRIASVYSVNKRTKQETGGGDGFEILERSDFEEDGNSGHYVKRVLHCKKQVPKSISWAIPEKYAHITENNRNAFPHTLTTFSCDGMGDNMILYAETRHITYTNGMEIPDNLLKLSEEDTKIREVFYLDILNGPASKKKEFDLHDFECEEAGISKLVASSNRSNDKEIPEWTQNYAGEMTMIVKVVKFHFQWRMIQSLLENLVTKTIFYHVYLDSHRAMVKWSPEWVKMSIDDAFSFEGRIQKELSQEQFDRD